jgi:UDP-N-acetylmuramoyl-L-alanyl-D-glutamate--2,6-diaminopimelate ligase
MMNPKKLARKVLPKKGIHAAEETYRKSRVYALQARHGFPAKGLRIIAVTGTNGKTTTASILNAILKQAGHKTAMLTTATIEINGEEKPNTSHRTMLLTADLVKFLKTAKKAKVDFVLFEATSQALHQHKLAGLPVEVAIMTNLTQDHLDYHKTMQEYANAKARVLNGYLKPKHVILNMDDEWYEFFAHQAVGTVHTYGHDKQADVRMSRQVYTVNGNRLRLTLDRQTVELESPLAGKFNAYNTAAAVAAAHVLGVQNPIIIEAVAGFASVPGRMESIRAGQPFGVVVDYAHTPDALQNVLETLKSITRGNLAVVFGATGDRDPAKRPVMGQIAAKYADKIYLTDDETYTEDPAKIIDEVLKGIEDAGGKSKTTVVPDRKDAIKLAFKQAKAGDTVLLAGIGHQDYRNQGGKPLPWDERQIARELLTKST